jgi:hypothetical protein
MKLSRENKVLFAVCVVISIAISSLSIIVPKCTAALPDKWTCDGQSAAPNVNEDDWREDR